MSSSINKASNPNTKHPTDIVFRLISAHPYLAALFCCVFLTPFCFGSLKFIPSYAPYAAWIALAAASATALHKFCKRKKMPEITAVFSAVSISALLFLCMRAYLNSSHKIVWIYSFGALFTAAVCGCFYKKENRQKLGSVLIIGCGLWLKLCYVLCTNINMRQHDEGWFSCNEDAPGHLGYISYLFTNHKLYQDDYRSMLQYCHPPLHHLVCAVWLQIMENIFHVRHEAALESMQLLTLFYSVSIIISAYLIFRHFGLNGNALYIPLIIISFHPCFTYLSALINNDALAWAFTMGAFLCSLRWYNDPSMKNILNIALCLGLGMMSKLSAALIAMPIAQLFLIVFLRKFKTSCKKLLGQFIAFGSICVPLGMWFPLRGLIRWGIPLTYVQALPLDMDQGISDIPFLERITDLSLSQVSNVFENWTYRNEFDELAGVNEHNPLIAILKNSIFGEFINGSYFNSNMLNVCKVFFWTSTAIALVAFVSMIIIFIKDRSSDKVLKLFIGTFYVILMANLYSMSYDYPLVCTMNFRYIMPTAVIGALFIGIMMKNKSKSQRPYSIAMTVAAPCFAIMTAMIYLTVCQKSIL